MWFQKKKILSIVLAEMMDECRKKNFKLPDWCLTCEDFDVFWFTYWFISYQQQQQKTVDDLTEIV